MITTTPWFDDDALVERVLDGRQPPRSWPDPDNRPTAGDEEELSAALSKKTRHLLVPIFILTAIPYVLAEVAGDGWWLSVLSLACAAYTFALAGPARDAAVGRSASLADALRGALAAFPRTALTTFVVTIVVLLGFLLVIPGFLLLPLLVRAPYEAAIGEEPFGALRRSIKSIKREPQSTLSAALAVIETVGALALLGFAIDWLGAAYPDYDSVIESAYLIAGIGAQVSLWYRCMSAYIVGDAAMADALTPANLASHRIDDKTGRARFWSSKAATAVRTLAAAVAIVGSGWALVSEINQPPIAMLAAGTTAPAFELESLRGQKHTMSQYVGKPTVLYFWAPWCGPCADQVPQLHALMQKHGTDINVVSIVLSYANRAKVEESVEKKNMRFEVLLGASDTDAKFQISAFPSLLVVGKEGTVTRGFRGVTRTEELSKALFED